jgi:hypothetical protein
LLHPLNLVRDWVVLVEWRDANPALADFEDDP